MGWEKTNGKWWYRESNGSYPRSKWKLIGGKWYYFNSSGYMVTGWLSYGGKWYYLDASGAMATGWVKVKNVSYHLSSSGAMDTGWFTDTNGKKYWLESSGAMFADGVKKIGSKWYRFGKDGAMTANLTDSEGRKPISMKLERTGVTFEGSWKLPSAATGSNSDERYASMSTTWEVVSGKSKIVRKTSQVIEEHSSAIDLDELVATNPNKEYTRADFYPAGSNKPKVDSVVLSVTGNGVYVKPATQTISYELELPAEPNVSWSYNTNSGTMNVTISSPEKEAIGERYDTMYLVKVKHGDGSEETLANWTSTREESVTLSYETSSYTSGLAEGQVVEFTALAYNRGLRGDNPSSSKPVKSTRTLAIPNAATIKSVIPTSKDTTGRITVSIEVGSNTDSVKLQRRHGEAGNWQDVQGATDNGSAKTLYDSVGLAEPVDGEYIYYRVISTKDNFTTVGMPFRADLLYTPRTTTGSTSIEIVSLEMDSDGSGAKMVVGWTEEKVGYRTEVSWSTDPNAWESNKRPDLYELSWEDDTPQSANWQHTATFYVRDLTAGVTYYFKARRTYEDGSYSSYASLTNVATYSETESVSLSAPLTIVRGDPITLYWTYSGDVTQTEYHVHPTGNPSIALASGRDSVSSASIPPERYGDAETISVYVSVGVGGELTDSNSVSIAILDAPTCTVDCAATCQSKPLSFTAYTDTQHARLGYKVIAEGAVQDRPDGTVVQLAGDVVSTGMLTPSWSQSVSQEEGMEYVTSVTDSVGNLIDGATYRIEAFTEDLASGLSSRLAEAEFTVEWGHQAEAPSDDITVVADVGSRSVTITLVPPQGAATGDVYDIYRGTAAGHDLIRESLPLNAVVTDRFAAFGDQMDYRICTRTVDGDIEWLGFNYNMPVDALRFDWAGGGGETIHNVKLSDSYSKDFEARAHMDGTVGGYWGPTVSRTGSYSATCIEGVDDGPIEELARHHGGVFCRTPDGDAYRCNVDVSRTHENSSMLIDYSLSITRVELNSDFMPTDDDVEGLVE